MCLKSNLKVRSWLPFILRLAAVTVLVLMWIREHEMRVRAKAEYDADLLRQQGFMAGYEKESLNLRNVIGSLKVEVDRLKKIDPSAKPVDHRENTTGPVVVPTPTGTVHAQPPVAPSGAPTSPAPPPSQVCLLSPGNVAEIRTTEWTLETGSGNRVLIGEASAWRLEPGPPLKLFGGPIRADLSTFEYTHTGAEKPGWMVGPTLGAGSGGWLLGVQGLAPGTQLWGWALRPWAGVSASPTGAWTAQAGLLVGR